MCSHEGHLVEDVMLPLNAAAIFALDSFLMEVNKLEDMHMSRSIAIMWLAQQGMEAINTSKFDDIVKGFKTTEDE